MGGSACTQEPTPVGPEHCDVNSLVPYEALDPGPPPPKPLGADDVNYAGLDLATALAIHNEGFNCSEGVHFKPLEGGYVIKERLVIDSPFDGDTDADGYTLVVDTASENVTVDARDFPDDSCIIEINASFVRLGAMRLIVPPSTWPICDFGSGNQYGELSIESP